MTHTTDSSAFEYVIEGYNLRYLRGPRGAISWHRATSAFMAHAAHALYPGQIPSQAVCHILGGPCHHYTTTRNPNPTWSDFEDEYRSIFGGYEDVTHSSASR